MTSQEKLKAHLQDLIDSPASILTEDVVETFLAWCKLPGRTSGEVADEIRFISTNVVRLSQQDKEALWDIYMRLA